MGAAFRVSCFAFRVAGWLKSAISNRPSAILALILLAAPALGDPTEDLREAERALEKRDLAAAEAAFRRALEGAAATAEQQAQAFEGMMAAALERGAAAALVAYLEGRRAATTGKERQALLLAALVRSYKARDGHFHGILPVLEKETGSSNYSARRLLHEVQSACAYFDKGVKRLEGELSLAAYQRGREVARPRWSRDRSWRVPAVPSVPAAGRPDYTAQVETIAPPPRPKLKAAGDPARLPLPQTPRAVSETPRSVAKPQAWPRLTSTRLAAALFTQAYQKANELAGQGLVDSAKAEYATLMQLFPDSPQAQQAARYALALFTRDRALAQGGDPLSAYLQWVRAVLGPKGSDFAEHIAFRSLADDADPAVVAREAGEFLKRYPDSKFAPSVRLQFAVALDRTGATPRAIEVLKPLAAPLDDALRVRAAHVLAWLYIFQGEAAAARGVLDALAAQTVSPEVAADARRVLQAMAATPLPKLAVAEVVGGGDPDDLLASGILQLADQLLAKGDGERAMDLYELYLRVARESQGFYAARERINRIKRTGRADEQ